MYVIKTSGEKEKFIPGKIYATLIRSGAEGKVAKEIVNRIKREAYNGISTREVLDKALDLLRKQKPEISARYDLKRAIMNLGPTGFPFEKFFAEILRNYGYETKTDQVIRGKIITHEVDIIARKKYDYMVECKYHNSPGIYTDVKVVLYVYARFLDLKNKFDQPWVATNTKCSNQAINYARGVKMKVTSWEYPAGESLRDLIEEKKLYPITILKSLNNEVTWKLSNAGIFIAKDLVTMGFDELKSRTKIQENILRKLVAEAKSVTTS